MNELVRLDPFEVVEGVINSVFRPALRNGVQQSLPMWEGTLPVDVAENDRSYIVWVDLPGVKKEDVDVAISGREVTVSAQFKRETAVDQGQGREQMLRRERPYGMVGRALTFPVELDDAKASAEYRDGVLMLTLPKHESAQVKRLTIH